LSDINTEISFKDLATKRQRCFGYTALSMTNALVSIYAVACSALYVSTEAKKSSNRYSVSTGPPAASG
jgi:hypothetical protein